ncbi:MAG: hypothetical protein V3S48_06000 [Candidatus Neomarinimicrobiota bacterium]
MLAPEMEIEDIIQQYPYLMGPLADAGLICMRCGEAVWGTLAELAESKGLKNLDEIIIKLNREQKRDKIF